MVGIGWIICILFWIGLFFKIGVSLNAFKAPSESDYQWLHEQEEILEQDFEKVYSIEGAQIKVQDSQIVVTLTSIESSDYELEVTFNQNKEKLKSKEICQKEGYRNTVVIFPKMEKYYPGIVYILLGILMGSFSALILESIYRNLYKKIKEKDQ